LSITHHFLEFTQFNERIFGCSTGITIANEVKKRVFSAFWRRSCRFECLEYAQWTAFLNFYEAQSLSLLTEVIGRIFK
jgi:hypothetical protein